MGQRAQERWEVCLCRKDRRPQSGDARQFEHPCKWTVTNRADAKSVRQYTGGAGLILSMDGTGDVVGHASVRDAAHVEARDASPRTGVIPFHDADDEC